MTLQDDLRANGEVAFAFAAELERAMGDEAMLTIGIARDSVAEVLPDEPVRAVVLAFNGEDGTNGTLAFVALQQFANTVESRASDEILGTVVQVALDAALRALSSLGGLDVDAESVEELDLAAANNALGGDEIVYPVLDGTDAVACLAVTVHTVARSATAPVSPTASAAADAAGAPLVLADVEMGVTAELGRTRMSVRELLSLTPGAVIDLDRAAGAPVDVLVNGTLIARGEVVVIEEEFGIRISEILKSGSPR
jgi:flagellar motor switch protein FliN/FliY